jgi:predicted heme/steroid binding protein
MQAGRDLTEQFMTCHGGMVAMLEQLPTVGFLILPEEE